MGAFLFVYGQLFVVCGAGKPELQIDNRTLDAAGSLLVYNRTKVGQPPSFIAVSLRCMLANDGVE
jgi:hypothetical protein